MPEDDFDIYGEDEGLSPIKTEVSVGREMGHVPWLTLTEGG